MEINRALTNIYSKFKNFEALPEEMTNNIKKSDLLSFLQNNADIDEKTIEAFLNLIFDENEEDQENIPRSNFDSKYISLLKIIEEDEDEPEEVKVNEAITPQKDSPMVELGSPILIKNSNQKMDNETSMETIELFKDIKFKDQEHIGKQLNFDSIIRPTNNFKFNTNLNGNDTNQKPKNQSPKNSGDKEQNNNFILPKIKFDYNNNKKSYKYNNLNFLGKNKLYSSNTPSKGYSIQQKLQDVYYQIHRPNDYGQHNGSPLKLQQSQTNTMFSINQTPTTGVMSSNSPILNEDYFSKIYSQIHPVSNTAIKPINGKINQFIKNEKRNELNQNYTRSNKISLNYKFEGLNKMLNCRSNGLNEDRILNEDDFVSLEDKIKEFSLLKKSTAGGKTKEIIKKQNTDENDIGISSNQLNGEMEERKFIVDINAYNDNNNEVQGEKSLE